MIPKFRAWDKKSKQIKNVEAINLSSRQVVLSEKALLEMGGMWSVCDMPTLLDDVILMQSTGLFDKNGVEIFEGDVVKTTRFFGRADEVGGFYEYDKELIGIVKVLEGAWVIDTGSEAVNLWTEIEENSVIGNVWEDGGLIDN